MSQPPGSADPPFGPQQWASMPPPVPPVEPYPLQANHVLHGVLTVLTCGAWAIVWIIVHRTTQQRNQRAKVNYQAALAHYTAAQWHWEQARRSGGHANGGW